MRVLDVSAQSSITDFLILATGTSEPHRRALRVELERVLDETHTHIVGIETAQESGWTVVDAFDVMIHIFSPEQRERIQLENLWRDAAVVAPASFEEERQGATAGRAAPARRSGPTSKPISTSS